MQKGLVTVVVPVYRTEKYLDRCITSIVNQTYHSLEILLVDDGSPDRCPQMCDDWAQRDSRIRVIHKENAGAGMARNTGIENASGEYICFIDSDDYIDPNMIAGAFAAAEEIAADIVLYGHSDVDRTGKVTARWVPEPGKSLYCGKEVQEELLPYMIHPSPVFSLWSSLFSMKMISAAHWRIPSEREVYAEDPISLLDLYGYAKKVAVLQESFYCYCNNGASLSHSRRVGDFDRVKDFYEKYKALCREHAYSDEVERRCMYPFVNFSIVALKYHAAVNTDRNEGKKQIQRIIADETLQSVFREIKKDRTNIKRRILFWAIRHKCCNLCYALLAAQNLSQS